MEPRVEFIGDSQNLQDTRSAGFVEDSKRKVQRTINTSITGLAETALNDVSKWREVLAQNPSALPFSLPPTLQADIDNINNTIAFTGFKVPPLNSLETDLKKALGDLANPRLSTAQAKVDAAIKPQLDLLKQLDWLTG